MSGFYAVKRSKYNGDPTMEAVDDARWEKLVKGAAVEHEGLHMLTAVKILAPMPDSGDPYIKFCTLSEEPLVVADARVSVV